MTRVYHFTEEQKAVRAARARAWNKTNKERVKQNQRLSLARKGRKKSLYDKEKTLQSNKRLRLKWPWYDNWQNAKQRCSNPKVLRYSRYGGRGIKCLLSKADMIYLWTRDRADLLISPSLDRIDNDGNYTLENCRFIEKVDNAKKRVFDSWRSKVVISDAGLEDVNRSRERSLNDSFPS